MDRSVYAAADNATYTIRIQNATTGAVITTDAYVTVTAVDVLGYTRPDGDLGLPASLQTRLHLSQEVRDFNRERGNLNGALQGTDTRYIDLLFGLQAWRQGIFDVRSLVNLNSNIANLNQADRQAIQGLYNFVLDRTVARAANTTTNVTTTNSTSNSSSNATNTTRPANGTNTTTNGTSNTTNTTRPNNGTNVTTNGTSNTTNTTRPNNGTNNGTSNGTNSTNGTTGNNTNTTVPAVAPTIRSGVLAFEEDPIDFMTPITNARNWTHPARANFNG